MNAHTPKGWHEDATRSECATLREARKRLRTCRELGSDFGGLRRGVASRLERTEMRCQRVSTVSEWRQARPANY